MRQQAELQGRREAAAALAVRRHLAAVQIQVFLTLRRLPCWYLNHVGHQGFLPVVASKLGGLLSASHLSSALYVQGLLLT